MKKMLIITLLLGSIVSAQNLSLTKDGIMQYKKIIYNRNVSIKILNNCIIDYNENQKIPGKIIELCVEKHEKRLFLNKLGVLNY